MKKQNSWEKEFDKFWIELTDEKNWRGGRPQIGGWKYLTFDNAVKYFIRQLLAQKEKEIIEEIETIIKQYSAALPIEIKRFGGEYCQGMHAGIDLCIEAILKLKKLKEQK